MCGRASADAVLNRPDSPIGASTINLAAQTKDEGYLGSTAAFIGSCVHEHAQTRIIILRSIRTVIGRSGRRRPRERGQDVPAAPSAPERAQGPQHAVAHGRRTAPTAVTQPQPSRCVTDHQANRSRQSNRTPILFLRDLRHARRSAYFRSPIYVALASAAACPGGCPDRVRNERLY
jgi:hypothetical protein